MPGIPVLQYLLEFAHTHVHRVSDAIQPSHPLSPLLLPSVFPSIRVFFNESQHQVAKILELQHQSSQWIIRVDVLQDWLVVLFVCFNPKLVIFIYFWLCWVCGMAHRLSWPTECESSPTRDGTYIHYIGRRILNCLITREVLGLTGLISLLYRELSKSLLYHHNSEASVLQRSWFSVAQLSSHVEMSLHDY